MALFFRRLLLVFGLSLAGYVYYLESQYHTFSGFYYRRVYAFKMAWFQLKVSAGFEKPVAAYRAPPAAASSIAHFDRSAFLRYEPAVLWAASEHGLDPDLIRAVIICESGYRADAVSPRGAVGLMQLMPQTAAGLGVRNPIDPLQNVSAGARYLKRLLVMFKNDLTLALAAYNAGPKSVIDYKGVPPFPETKNYVVKVNQTYKLLKGVVRAKASR